MPRLAWIASVLALLATPAPGAAPGPVLDKQALLDAQDFWDNRDWDWYKANIPFFECPDPALNTTYYYRWELLTKHLTYGSPATGYVFTEFLDRPFWSGTYGAISCPAGHQLYEARWLRDPRFARDYARYWFRTPGAQPRNYSTWLADAAWAVHRVHPDPAFIAGLLPDLIRNYEGWERSHFVPEVGLFWQTGHDDGMEFNINSRQTADILRGAPAFRPTLNSYLQADALAIARVADLAGDAATALGYRARAAALKRNLLAKLWDPSRRFFFPMALRDEVRDGKTVKAGSLTYRTGPFAGDPHGRELIGYVPWQFGLPGHEFEAAWDPLMRRDGFRADFGPTTVERRDPQFLVTDHCCWWSGQSWPYATTQTLKALANRLQGEARGAASKAEYLELLATYARTHRKGGRPYLAEGANPDTGSWEGYDSPGHSDHYFHSGFVDLIVTGLVGLQARDDDVLEVRPLAPESWAYFAIDDLPYRGRRVGIAWDRDGDRYGLGKGLHLLVDGRPLASADRLGPLAAPLPAAAAADPPPPRANFAVNNDGTYFPRATASSTGPGTAAAKAIDGNYWYHAAPPNRWTCERTPAAADWLALDFGAERPIDAVALYLLDDSDANGVAAPARIDLEFWDGSAWAAVPGQVRTPTEPAGHRANVIRFPARKVERLRAVLAHRPGVRSGLTEFEAWGDGTPPFTPARPPAGNLAYNPGDRPFPKASASFTSRFDRVERVNDGGVNFAPNPPDRWTSFESPNPTDWVEIDLGAPKVVSRVELAIYDDRGGVQTPADYRVEIWDGAAWRPAARPRRTPEQPAGGQYNDVRFDRVETARVRILLVHRGAARSGLSELLIWGE